MCGIAGLLHLAGESVEPERSTIERMVQSIRHRGPDGGAVWGDGPIWLGHRRLAILDLSDHGRQPMCDTSGRFWISYNGEVYNFPELRRQLEQEGMVFRSSSDTEVVIQGFAKWGKNALPKLNGMFAFAIWDRLERRLYLARDGIGMKPLFFAIHGNYLRFASEIKAILVDGRVPRKPSLDGLSEFFAFGYSAAPNTGFEGIHQLEPGELMVVDLGQIRKERWYRLPYPDSPPQRSLDESVEVLDHALDAAVGRHCISDVPLSAFLSGGLDSSAVVRSVSHRVQAGLMDGPIRTCTIRFAEESFDESPFAEIVARRFGTDHASEQVAAASAELLSALVEHAEDPLADNSALPTYILSGFAAQTHKVALSGDGADELLAGYSTYLADRFAAGYRRIPKFLRSTFIEPAVRCLPNRDVKYHWAGLARRFVEGAMHKFPLDHCRWRTMIPERYWSSLFLGSVKELANASFDRYANCLDSAPPWLDPVEQALHLDLCFHLPNDMMVKVDRMSMAHGLEVRIPFLDQEVIRAALSTPSRFKLHRRQGKFVLRKSLNRDLPKSITGRRKAGFLLPIERWLRNEWWEFVKANLNQDFCDSTGILSPRGVQMLLDDFVFRRKDAAYSLFTLLVFSLWWKRWMGAGRQVVNSVITEPLPRIVSPLTP